jgi:hypothetical protein
MAIGDSGRRRSAVPTRLREAPMNRMQLQGREPEFFTEGSEGSEERNLPTGSWQKKAGDAVGGAEGGIKYRSTEGPNYRKKSQRAQRNRQPRIHTNRHEFRNFLQKIAKGAELLKNTEPPKDQSTKRTFNGHKRQKRRRGRRGFKISNLRFERGANRRRRRRLTTSNFQP